MTVLFYVLLCVVYLALGRLVVRFHNKHFYHALDSTAGFIALFWPVFVIFGIVYGISFLFDKFLTIFGKFMADK